MLCVGFVGSTCAVWVNARPTIEQIFHGDVCKASKTERCDEVHVIADNFAVNPNFSCLVVVRLSLSNVAFVTRLSEEDHCEYGRLLGKASST